MLRLWQIGLAPFWYDENFSAWIASLPWARMLDATAGDVHPPLYYALLWLLERSGSHAPWLLRLPSALSSIAALCLVGPICNRLNLDSRVTLITAAIMALSPAQLYFAQEARMYSLLQLEVLLMVLAMLDRRWWLLGAVSAAALWTHNYAGIYCMVIYAIAFIREMGRPVVFSENYLLNLPWQSKNDEAQFKHIILAGVIPLVLYVPWVVYGLSYQLPDVKSNWWLMPTTPGGAVFPLYYSVFGLSLTGLMITLGAVLVFLLVMAQMVHLYRSGQRLAAVLLFLPMVAALTIEAIYRPVYLHRAFLPVSLMLYVLMAGALSDMRIERRWLVGGALGALLLWGAVLFPYQNLLNKTRMAILADVIKPGPGDVIYHSNCGTLVEYWDRYPGAVQVMEDAQITGGLSRRTVAALGVRLVRLEDLHYPGRLWVIFGGGPTVSTAVDARLENYVAAHASVRLLDLDDYYPSAATDGGVWLVEKP